MIHAVFYLNIAFGDSGSAPKFGWINVPELTGGKPNCGGLPSNPGLPDGGTELSIDGVTLSTLGGGVSIAGPCVLAETACAVPVAASRAAAARISREDFMRPILMRGY